jgi:hypothetical protein
MALQLFVGLWELLQVFDPIHSQEFLATDPEARARFPALPEKKSSGSGTESTQLHEYN